MLKKVFIWGIALFGMTAISSNVSASAASDVYSVATVAESLTRWTSLSLHPEETSARPVKVP